MHPHPPKEAFVDSETETEFTEVTLSPKNEQDCNPASSPACSISKPELFHKRQEFHSLPHASSNWEANNLMEEIIHGSHIHQQRSSSSTMELDSLSARYSLNLDGLDGPDGIQATTEEDSLNFNLQEVDEEDSLTTHSNYENDSLYLQIG